MLDHSSYYLVEMIQRLSSVAFAAGVRKYDVEFTPGGYFVRVEDLDCNWVGLYRFDTELRLLACCHGSPPRSLAIDVELAVRLQQALGVRR